MMHFVRSGLAAIAVASLSLLASPEVSHAITVELDDLTRRVGVNLARPGTPVTDPVILPVVDSDGDLEFRGFDDPASPANIVQTELGLGVLGDDPIFVDLGETLVIDFLPNFSPAKDIELFFSDTKYVGSPTPTGFFELITVTALTGSPANLALIAQQPFFTNATGPSLLKLPASFNTAVTRRLVLTAPADAGFIVEGFNATIIPLPATLPLTAGGLLLLGWIGRRRRG